MNRFIFVVCVALAIGSCARKVATTATDEAVDLAAEITISLADSVTLADAVTP